MANPIFHSQYTAAQIEDLIENGAPIIQNGYWWRWDVATQQYVNTNITADSETAAQAAEAAQAAAEYAQGKAEDAQTAAETAQGLAEDARDAAAASAASIAASAAQIDANTARINYVALREEEDRQILFGSIVEAAEDTYPELRSAPIHNAITIGGSVYPRMDRTRMAIDAIKGRTVAFNQLAALTIQSGTYDDVTITINADHSITVSWEAVASLRKIALTGSNVVITNDHVYYAAGGQNATVYIENTYSSSVDIKKPRTILKSNYTSKLSQYKLVVTARNTAGSVTLPPLQLIDLTAQYGTTLADSIYAMEQATEGAGVAYVRQRMDLDYYASNAGELVAPVVSGVSVTGFNLWDEVWELGGYNQTTGAKDTNDDRIRNKNAIPVLPSTAYYFRKGGSGYAYAYYYDADMRFISYGGATNAVFTTPSNCRYLNFYCTSTYGTVYNNDICINLSNPSRNGEYQPYQHTALSFTATRLDGVGTAQDYIEVVEDGENDYSLHLHKVMGEVDLGTLTWQKHSAAGDYQTFFYNSTDSLIPNCGANGDLGSAPTNILCLGYSSIDRNTIYYTSGAVGIDVERNGGAYIAEPSKASLTASQFKEAMSGVMLCYQLATPTETTIAEHLTLAEVSAIAENGGIISIVNENGHIVQPDMVADVVISRSAS